MTNQRVCVIIPAFNESKVIGSVVLDVIKAFKAVNISAEIVVVDDCSRDDTTKAAKKEGAVVIRHILNTGAGGATATGLRYAKENGFDIAVTMDADGQHLSSDVVNGVVKMVKDGGNLLIGSRLTDFHGMPGLKVLGNKGLSLITNILFGVKSTDSQSGLRVYSRQAIERLSWKSSGYVFCSEMLWRAKQTRLAVGEYPIKAVYTSYSLSKGQNSWNGVNILMSMLDYRFTELFQ